MLAQALTWLALLDLIALEYSRAGLAPGCGAGSACVEVTSGQYSQLLGIPWTWLGLLYYAGLATLLPLKPGWVRALAPLGALVSLLLLGLQVGVIGRVCPFCLASCLLALALAGVLRERPPGVVRARGPRLLVTVLLLALALRAAWRDAVRLDPPTPEVSAGIRAWRGHGPVRLVLYLDLECPHCSEALHRLLALPPDRVALAVRFSPQGCPASAGCRAAAACHGAPDFWTALLDAERVIGGRRAPQVSPAVAQAWLARTDEQALRTDVELASRLGLRRVPVLFVNERRVHGPLSAATLGGLVERFSPQE